MRGLVLLIIGFTLGYFFHQYATPLWSQTKIVTSTITGLKEDPKNAFVTAVDYENGSFKPNEVTMRRGNYLTITNRSEALMWLDSANALFTTPRGYGLSEQLRIQATETGKFEVRNKLNINATLKVTIEE